MLLSIIRMLTCILVERERGREGERESADCHRNWHAR